MYERMVLPQAPLDSARTRFAQWDTDKDGRINALQFMDYMNKLDVRTPPLQGVHCINGR